VAAEGGGLNVFDISNVEEPRRLDYHYIRHTDLIVLSPDESTVFIWDPYEDGLVAYDVSDDAGAAVRLEGRWWPTGTPDEMVLTPDGTTLVATTQIGLHVIDVSERAPNTFAIIGTLALTSPVVPPPAMPDVPVELFVSDDERRPHVLDGGGVEISPDGNTVYVADGALHLIDLTDRTAPAPVAAFQTPSSIGELAIFPDGSTAVVVSGGARFAVDPVVACVGLIDLGGPPSLEGIDAPAPGAQRYLLRWTDRYPLDPEQIAWHATGGEVVIGEIDQLGKTAVVHWTPPADEPHTLSVGVGNYHYFQAVRTTSP